MEKQTTSIKMIKIYHNPRCSKSRQGLSFLNDLNEDVTIINYMEQPFTFEELSKVIKFLGIKPIELVRTKENIWKEQFKNQELTDQEIIQAMVDHPKLIERPIVVKGDKAIVARPTEKINELI